MIDKFEHNKIFKIFQIVIPTIMFLYLVFEVQRGFTGIPKFGNVYLNESQSEIYVTVSVRGIFGNFTQFIYFTTLSNMAFVIIFFLNWTCKLKINSYVIYAITIYMIITGVIFWTMLAPFWTWGQIPYYDFVDTYEHGIVVLCAIGWFLFSKKEIKFKKGIIPVLSFPITYLLFSFIFSWTQDFNLAIYPFLNFKNVFGLGLEMGWSILLSIISIFLIAGGFVLLLWILIKFKRYQLKA